MRLFFWLLTTALLCGLGCGRPQPDPPAGVHLAVGNTSCLSTPWQGYARLSPATPGRSDLWQFVIPSGTADLSPNTYFRYFDGSNWSSDCWLSDTWYQPPNNPNSPRYLSSMFWLQGTYTKIWMKVWNQGAQAYECWERDLNYDWSLQSCGLMDLDSNSTPIYWSTYTP